MAGEIKVEELLVSGYRAPKGYSEYLMDPKEPYSYVKWLDITFADTSNGGDAFIETDEGQKRARIVAKLFGALLLGAQASDDELDFVEMCDDCNGDLCTAADELNAEGLLELPFDGRYPNVLYIHQLELSSDVLDAPNIREFFDWLPQVVFQLTNVKPLMACYVIASVEDYYDKETEKTEFDKRSVDGYSPLVFSENGYKLSNSGNILYKVFDEECGFGA